MTQPTLNTRALTVFAWIVMLFGVFLCLGGFPLTLAPVDQLFRVFHPGEGHAEWGPHLRFSTGLMGAVIFGWGLMIRSMVRVTPHMGAAAAQTLWSSVTTAFLIWYAVDGAISLANGFWVNAVSNTVILAIYFFAIAKSGLRDLSPA